MKDSFKTILFLWGALTAFSASAIDYGEVVKTRLSTLGNIKSSTATMGGSRACFDRYQDLYQDGVLNIALGFGYWDNSPNDFVFDQYIANGLRNNLVLPCSSGVNLCGFIRTGDVFRKMVPGPDGKLNQLTIRITQGTLSNNNLHNTTIMREKQFAKCEAATEKFFNEVASGSEVVMYIGHARDGGGPDFCPPVRKADKNTDYDWYQKETPGLNKLLKAMETSKAHGKENQIVGLYSCYSRGHFHKKMVNTNPDAGYILTDVAIGAADAIASVASTIDAIIGHKCGKSFTNGLKLSGGVKMHGMFTKESP